MQTESHAREIKSSPVDYNDNKEKRLALRRLPLQMIAHLRYCIYRVPSFPCRNLRSDLILEGELEVVLKGEL